MTRRPMLRLPARHPALCLAAGLALSACDRPMDLDLRGGAVNTSDAAASATADRPQPDGRGVISYPNYQVAVAERGDTVTTLAERVGTDPVQLARFNGVQPFDPLRAGEVVALPERVAEPSGGIAAGPLQPAGQVDIATLAGNAIDRAPASTARSAPAAPGTGGVEPVRHRVERGETAYTIARLYNVTPRALADWNGLDSSFSVREGQYLLIPVALEGQAESRSARVIEPTRPGEGSPTPTPPSASAPLPPAEPVQTAAAPTAPRAAEPPAPTPAPDLGQESVAKPDAAMTMPVSGTIIRDYAKGRNDGIDIAAAAGTPVKAAASGTVAAITENTDGIPILVIKHPDNLLTVYTHIDGISVTKGDAISRGQTIGRVRAGDPARMHFEVRDGFESVDPNLYLG